MNGKTGIQPFHCGTQDADWVEANCILCVKWKDGSGGCEIAEALQAAFWGDGRVSVEIASRMGYIEKAYTWDCPEKIE